MKRKYSRTAKAKKVKKFNGRITKTMKRQFNKRKFIKYKTTMLKVELRMISILCLGTFTSPTYLIYNYPALDLFFLDLCFKLKNEFQL